MRLWECEDTATIERMGWSRDMCANGGIKPPVKQGNCCEDIERVLFSNIPENFWRMAGGVAECAEDAFYEVH